MSVTLAEKEQLDLLFGANRALESALGKFFREQAIHYSGKLIRAMKAVPPQTEEGMQTAAICSEYESLMAELKAWAKRQQA